MDKSAGRMFFLQGPSALHFRAAIEEIPEDERDEETIDAFLDDTAETRRAPSSFTDVLKIGAHRKRFEDRGKWVTSIRAICPTTPSGSTNSWKEPGLGR